MHCTGYTKFITPTIVHTPFTPHEAVNLSQPISNIYVAATQNGRSKSCSRILLSYCIATIAGFEHGDRIKKFRNGNKPNTTNYAQAEQNNCSDSRLIQK